jgi:23S rRNA-/tRNA-specific pseudouridylate synthase
MTAETLAHRLKTLYPEASGVSRKDWLAHGRVTVNGTVVRDGRAEVGAGDKIRLGTETVARVRLAHPLKLVHEDEHLLVIDKPADLLTIATDKDEERTTYRMIYTYLAAKRPPERVLIVHSRRTRACSRTASRRAARSASAARARRTPGARSPSRATACASAARR